MKRQITQDLIAWKLSKNRKPILLRGARQTGKTWLLKEFGKNEYQETIYINFEEFPQLQGIFYQDFDIARIITAIEIHAQKKVIADETLLIFDEIQMANKGITSLKYFYENAPQYHIVAAGSLLGLFLHNQTSFPVGKVEIMELAPMSFIEVLNAMGEERLVAQIQHENWDILVPFHDKLLGYLKQYMFVGGMPEVVLAYQENKDFELVRKIQKQIIMAYEADFSKHAPKEVFPRIQMVWNSIPAQLAKENKKFVFNILREGARAKDYELAIQWLQDCGLILKVNRIKKPEIPLKAYEESSVFKVFLVDVGLLGAMSMLDVSSIINNEILNEFKGAMAEQFVLQQLKTNKELFITYWTNERSTAEVDFVVQKNNEVIVIEVKSGENVRSKSFKFFYEQYQPNMALRMSGLPFKQQDWLTNIPLYGVNSL